MNVLGNSQEFLIRELIVEEVDKVLLGRAILPFCDRAEDGLVVAGRVVRGEVRGHEEEAGGEREEGGEVRAPDCCSSGRFPRPRRRGWRSRCSAAGVGLGGAGFGDRGCWGLGTSMTRTQSWPNYFHAKTMKKVCH